MLAFFSKNKYKFLYIILLGYLTFHSLWFLKLQSIGRPMAQTYESLKPLKFYGSHNNLLVFQTHNSQNMFFELVPALENYFHMNVLVVGNINDLDYELHEPIFKLFKKYHAIYVMSPNKITKGYLSYITLIQTIRTYLVSQTIPTTLSKNEKAFYIYQLNLRKNEAYLTRLKTMTKILFSNWYARETNNHNHYWRWSKGNSEINIMSSTESIVSVSGIIHMANLPRIVKIYLNNKCVLSLDKDHSNFNLSFKANKKTATIVRIISETAPIHPNFNDPRLLAFSIDDYEIKTFNRHS